MATTYPGSQQTWTNPSASDPLNSPSHSGNHTTLEDTLEAVQAAVGYTGAFEFANHHLSNLTATVAINTSLISDADSTDDLGSSTYYWANTYTDKIYLNSTATMDGTTAGQVNLTGNLDVSASMAVGNNASISSSYCLHVNYSWDDVTGKWAQWCAATVTATDANASAGGIGGFVVPGGDSFSDGGANVFNGCGLQFGPYAFGTTVDNGAGGRANARFAGIVTWGASAYITGNFKALEASGLVVAAMGSTLNGNGYQGYFDFTDLYGIKVVASIDPAGAYTLTADNEYGIWVGKPVEATNNYQVVLDGTGAGSGLWLGGTSNYARLYASAASTLDLDIAGTTILQVTANGFGYSAGGSAQTQGTSKSTTVTINAYCGTITTHNATLNAGTVVSFQVTNSKVAATDVVIVNHDSGGSNLGGYTINASGMAAGHFHIDIRNNTAGNLSEALVIRFVVIKAVAS